MNRKLIQQVGLAMVVVVLAVAWRVINHRLGLAPNLEIVTAAVLLGSVYFHRYIAAAIPVAVMFASDAIIGNERIALFTWSAFALMLVGGYVLRRMQVRGGKLVLTSAGVGLGSAVFFFLWTNFGVWALGDGTFYPHTFQGLMLCYAYGLPFFGNTLVSGAVLTPLAFAAVEYGKRLVEVKRWQLVRA